MICCHSFVYEQGICVLGAYPSGFFRIRIPSFPYAPRWNGNQRRAFLPLPHCSLAPPACCAPQPLCGFQSLQINITKAMRPLQGPISLLAFHSIDVHAAIARNRKKVVAAGSRCESVYNRAGSRTYFFCTKEGARKRADVFLQRKTEQSELCSDMAYPGGFEPLAFGVGGLQIESSAIPRII